VYEYGFLADPNSYNSYRKLDFFSYK